MTANVRFGQEVFRSDQLKVLILDDEKPFTEELNEFFQHSGYKSFEANTWDEAQKILETEKNVRSDSDSRSCGAYYFAIKLLF